MREITCISFDVYNTLVKRTLPPNMLYKFMEKRWGENFSAKRMNAEQLLQVQKVQNYSLADIYSTGEFDDLEEDTRIAMIKYEEECEIQNTLPRIEIKRLYDLFKGKLRVICISDMYLNSTVIRKILDKNEYFEIEKVYVSCDEKKSKYRGDLFTHIIKDMGISARNLLHIGDALRSDFFMPRCHGISSKLVKYDYHSEERDILYQTGFSVFGPVFYEFMVWLHEIKDEKTKTLCFLAREGDFLKQCYEIIYDTNEKILYISRESVIHGCIAILLKSMKITDVIKLISIQRNETNEGFIRRLGLDIEKYNKFLAKEKINPTDKLAKTIVLFLEKYKFNIIQDTIKYEEDFWEYLQQSIDVNAGEILLVDIGWNGSMQELLSLYLYHKKCNLHVEGAYLGCTNDKGKEGFLFCGKNGRYADILNFSGLLESISMPSYGTVLGYEKQKECIKPVFGTSEHTAIAKNTIETVQKGILDLCYNTAFGKGETLFDRNSIIKKLISYGCSPGIKDVYRLGKKISFYENGRIYPLVNVPKVEEFLTPKRIYNKFLECSWKTGWMRATFRLPLPWNLILKIIRKRADKTQNRGYIIS